MIEHKKSFRALVCKIRIYAHADTVLAEKILPERDRRRTFGLGALFGTKTRLEKIEGYKKDL